MNQQTENAETGMYEYDTDYEIGRDNVEWLGIEMHNPVFFLSAGLILLFSAATLAFPQMAYDALTTIQSGMLSMFDWLFVVAPIVTLVFCIGFAVSPLGAIRLGGADARPEFGTFSWVAMLFAAGVGIGYMFYGAAEPLGYYTDWAGAPFDAEPGTEASKRLAFSASLFHWGLFPWGVYAIVGLAFGFFAYNKGLPLTIRSAFYPLLGERIWGWPGHFIDLFAVISTVFGLATSIGIGATQATSGLAYLFGFSPTTMHQVALIAVITGAAVISVIRGMDGGVKLLSNINMATAFVLLVFVIAFGVGVAILPLTGQNLLNSFRDMPALTNWIGREDTAFFQNWTIFYWAWWIAWGPFVGMFIARISKGRTVREYVTIVLIAPFIIGAIWFTAFGEAAISLHDAGVGDFAGGVSDASLVLFQLLDTMPVSELTSAIAILLLLIFITTSADSGALVVDSITSGGKTTAPVVQRIFWALMLGLTASALLVGGGTRALQALQAGTIAAALPFTFILMACCVSLFLGLRDESRSIAEAGDSATASG